MINFMVADLHKSLKAVLKYIRFFDSNVVLYEYMKQFMTSKSLLNGVLLNSYSRTIIFKFIIYFPV